MLTDKGQDLEDHTLYLPTRQLIMLVATIALSYCLAVMEQSVLASALPTIASRKCAVDYRSNAKSCFCLCRLPRWQGECLGRIELSSRCRCWTDDLWPHLVRQASGACDSSLTASHYQRHLGQTCCHAYFHCDLFYNHWSLCTQ